MYRYLLASMIFCTQVVLGTELFSYDEFNRDKVSEPGRHNISMNFDPRTIRVNNTVDLKTPQGELVKYRVEDAKITNLGNWMITAKSLDQPSRLQLVVNPRNQVIGSFYHKERRYEINSELGALQLLDVKASGRVYREIDDGPAGDPNHVKPIGGSIKKNNYRTRQTTGTATIDVLMYYDDTLIDPLTKIDSVVSTANTTFTDSGIDIKINIVKSLPLDLPEPRLDLQPDLIKDMLNEEGAFANIATDRETYKADIVHVLQDDIGEDDSCGLAYIGVRDGIARKWAFLSLTYWDQDSCSPYTFVHEIGHNLGSNHNRENARDKEFPNALQLDGAFSYSYGHRVDGDFRTVMSYVSDQYESRVGYFSTPQKTDCAQQSCGIAIGEIGEADNVTAFNDVRHLVAGINGDAFVPETIQAWKRSFGSCEDTDGRSGHYNALYIQNTSPFTITAPKAYFLAQDGSTHTIYDAEAFDEETIEAGSYNYAIPYANETYCRTSVSPLGNEIRSGFWSYEDPVTGETRETSRITWDPSYTVQIRSGPNGSISNAGSLIVTAGETVTVTASPNLANGYGLAWFEGSCSGTQDGYQFTSDRINSDCTITAQFEEEPIYSITPSARSGGTISPSSAQLVESGDNITFTIAPNSGYEIDRVRGSCTGTLSEEGETRTYSISSVSSDCTVIAEFKEKTITPGSASAEHIWTIPGTSCKANDPGTSIRLQSRESGLTNTESDVAISVTCPVPLPLAASINDINSVEFSINLNARTSNENVSEMSCALSKYRGHELISTDDVTVSLAQEADTLTTVAQSVSVSRLSTFAITCSLPGNTAITVIDTRASY